ncbi:hypothetical protein WY02_00300 [Pseudonocardia sp. AL041005-10]|nr:hypothetical protein WY02_00300 [Pseudonocardia sp. AL041005-10]
MESVPAGRLRAAAGSEKVRVRGMGYRVGSANASGKPSEGRRRPSHSLPRPDGVDERGGWPRW